MTRDWLIVFDAAWLTFVCLNFVYCMVAVYRTHEDRIRLLMAVMHRPVSGPHILTEYEAVSFGRHLLARLTFHDPLALYGARTHDAIENPKTEVIRVGVIAPGHFVPHDDDDDGKPTIN